MPGRIQLNIPVFSYDKLREVAANFLRDKHQSLELPVPIEQIIDNDLKLDITCLPSLQSICGVDAFINSKCDTIYVDGGVYLSPNENRLRFSLAHELSHRILHADVISQLKFNSMEEWLTVHEAIDEDDYAWLEWQAHSLAGLLLVPDALLSKLYADQTEAMRAKHGEVDFVRSLVEKNLSYEFEVSTEVVQRRCAKDGLGG